HGLVARTAPQQTEGASGESGIDVERHDVPTIPRLAKQRFAKEGIEGIQERRGTSVDRLPFELEEAAETPQRLADIDGDVLSLTGSKLPQRRNGGRFGGKPNRGRAAKPQRTRDDRVPAVKRDLAAAVRGRHLDVPEHVVDCGKQVEVVVAAAIREVRTD